MLCAVSYLLQAQAPPLSSQVPKSKSFVVQVYNTLPLTAGDREMQSSTHIVSSLFSQWCVESQSEAFSNTSTQIPRINLADKVKVIIPKRPGPSGEDTKVMTSCV
ncbi:hypothetical protein PHYPO_G00237320 [Pangasianodon hypophthalmus]|uniref:Uncharacterized protein n=1 Tax=Pangasianodon hypophthalmus TaxID=310915 RepID=A0A5N5NKV6_PANHP|nr:hypothetical protein PHYPO_G00237320 [Pangasianodon hypophthalmus]